MEVKDNLGGERQSVYPAVGLWSSCSGASCLTGLLSVFKLLFLVLQQYFNPSAPASLGHLECFLEHMVKMAKRLDSTLFSKYIHDCRLFLLHSEERCTSTQTGDRWGPCAIVPTRGQS